MDAWYLAPDAFLQLGPHSGLSAGDGASAADQTTACLTAIDEELRGAGLDLDDLVNVHVLLAHIGQKHGEYNPAYNDFFHSRGLLHKPARSTAGAPLAPGELVRMTAIAALRAA
jgi:enamine deaminase RidA (YjgF/YER057c/UK114 family)